MWKLSVSTLFWIKICIIQQVAPTRSIVFPVYSRPHRQLIAPNKSDTMELVMKSSYQIQQPKVEAAESRSFERTPTNTWDEPSEEDPYLAAEKMRCWRGYSVMSCWRYNSLQFIQNTLKTPSVYLLSNASGRSLEDTTAVLVSYPGQLNNESILPMSRSENFGFGGLYNFFERQLSRFMSQHGILFSSSTWDEAVIDNFQTPVILEDYTKENEIQEGRSGSTQRKVKRKSVLFPLLVLFKFFKIKMILVPILLTVLFVKKLLIVSLALAPNVIGLFRLCRPGGNFNTPFGLGVAPTGILQDITDNRGEFSTLYNSYAAPYGHRTRQMSSYATNPGRQSNTHKEEEYESY